MLMGVERCYYVEKPTHSEAMLKRLLFCVATMACCRSFNTENDELKERPPASSMELY